MTRATKKPKWRDQEIEKVWRARMAKKKKLKKTKRLKQRRIKKRLRGVWIATVRKGGD